MSGSNTAISRRRLLQGAGAMWLLSVSQVSLAAVSQVVAVRVWPSSTYTRVTVESNRVLKYKQFALSNPERVVVDLEGVNLNSVLKGMAAQIRGDDPFIKSARVGQFDPQTVRMVFELKQNVKPQLFALAPVATFKERLVMDLYPANATDIQDPLLALLEDYNKGDLQRQVPPAQSGPQPGKAGRDRPIVIMLDPGHGGEDSGAVGKYRTREKDVVLQIARRLKALIDKEGNMRAYMTRNEDVFIPLKVRVAKAQKQRADLFVSIHADAFTSRQPSGSSVFALSTKGATSTAAKYLALISGTFVPMAGAALLPTLLRCRERPRLPLYASIAAALLNTGLNYILIFGKLGLAPMGIKGAAKPNMSCSLMGSARGAAAFRWDC